MSSRGARVCDGGNLASTIIRALLGLAEEKPVEALRLHIRRRSTLSPKRMDGWLARQTKG